MPARPQDIALEPAERRRLAAELFNYCWTLMDIEQRTERQTEMMVAAAYASRLFWEEIGQPVHHSRGEWQISRACALAGLPVEAMRHAEACLALCKEHGLSPFDVGCAYEGLARAQQLAGDAHSAAASIARAREIAAQLADTEERETLTRDLDAFGA